MKIKVLTPLELAQKKHDFLIREIHKGWNQLMCTKKIYVSQKISRPKWLEVRIKQLKEELNNESL